MVRIYLMPIAGVGTKADPRAPKYRGLFGADWTMSDYGPEAACLVAVENISPAAHASLIANADCTALPADLTQQIGGQLTAVKNALATLNIPDDWVQSTFTYLNVLRIVFLVFLFLQRLNGLLPGVRLFGTGVTLDTLLNQLPANVRTALNTTATSFGFSTAGLSGTNTLRQALKAMADQFPALSFSIGSQVF